MISNDGGSSPENIPITVTRTGDVIGIMVPLHSARYLSQCLNEIVNGVDMDDDEIEARIGTDRETLRQMLRVLLKEIRR